MFSGRRLKSRLGGAPRWATAYAVGSVGVGRRPAAGPLAAHFSVSANSRRLKSRLKGASRQPTAYAVGVSASAEADARPQALLPHTSVCRTCDLAAYFA